MSFFFTKAKPRDKARSKATRAPLRAAPTATGRHQTAVLRRLGCSACPLNHADVVTPKMGPTLAPNTTVYFLAEAPGKDEDEKTGKPLTGPTGRLLRECIPDGEERNCSFDNIVRDRPPGNRTPTWHEIECCRNHITKSIEQAKPRLIVGLGIVPLSWMLGSTDMAGMRGRLFTVKVGSHECHFLPTYDPAFIIRIARNKSKPLNSMMGHCLRMDIKRVFELALRLKPVHVDTEIEVRTNIQCFDGSQELHFRKLLDLLAAAQAAPLKAVDLETKGLRPYKAGAAIMTAAISFANTNFAFALDHPKSRWGKEQRSVILKSLRAVLEDDTIKVAHNAPFELEWLIWLFDKAVVNHVAWECTQMQSHFLDERRGKQARGGDDKRATYQSLDFLYKQYFGVSYKSMFKLNKKDMSQADLGETLIYNGADTKATLRLFKHQEALLKKHGLHDAYLEALPRQPTVALMQSLGIDVDQNEVKRIQKKLSGEIDGFVDQIKNLKVVKAYVADRKEFNPASGADVVTIFRDYLKRREVTVKDGDTTRFSVDKGVLDQIDHPLAQLIVQFRNRSKLKSTYVDGLELGKGETIFPDGLLHTNFNTTFAETGRTSSDEPNLQNFPQRNDAWVRKQIIAPPGHLLVAFDYGQLEACTAATCSKDRVLVKALWEDYDIHMDFAKRVLSAWPEAIIGEIDAKRMKIFRSVVKNKLVFPAIFGAQNSSIAGYLNAPEDIIDVLMDEFWGTYTGLKRWQDRTMKGYYENGYVESPTGRRRHYPMTRNQAINDPIQSFACDIVCDAMSRLSYEAVQRGAWHLHPRLNIHDDLTFVIPDNDKVLEESIEEIYRTMLTPPYSIINVPLSVTASIGKNWYEMEEIGKFWSHKDL